MEATKSSTLAINTTVNNAGGNITASGGTVAVVNATVQGGTLNANNGGILETAGTATLDGMTQGALTLSAGSTYISNPGTNTNVLGTITDKGNIQVIGGSNANTILGLNANTTLNGGGTVTLAYNGSGAGAAYIEQNAGGLTLTNQDTIQGAGVIGNGGLTLVNAKGGTLFANVSGQTLLINGSGNITNDGTMRVASGSAMHVANGAFTNFAGTTLTGGTYNVAGTLEIDELGNTGGEIVTNAANVILNGTNSSFIDAGGQNALSKFATNSKGASFTITGGRNFTTAGKFTNNGIADGGQRRQHLQSNRQPDQLLNQHPHTDRRHIQPHRHTEIQRGQHCDECGEHNPEWAFVEDSRSAWQRWFGKFCYQQWELHDQQRPQLHHGRSLHQQRDTGGGEQQQRV